jgi:hypothetical protein
VKVNWCPAHFVCVLQSRSLLSVGTACSYSSATHTVAVTHASSLSTVEKLVPKSHVAHWRSAVMEPATARPEPTAHVRHAAQVSVAVVLALASDLKKPDAHVSHARSLLAVAAVLVKVPAAQTALTVAHASPLASPEYVVPATQAAHWRSVDAVPSFDLPSPIGHVAHAAQVSVAVVLALALDLNVPPAHASHVRSLMAVATVLV